MANAAPMLLDRFQYIPKTIGVNNDTRLKTDDTPTSSNIFEFRHANTVAAILKKTTESRVIISNCLSVGLFFINGLITFSENNAAGARMEELVVLITADNNEPKNKIWIGTDVWRKTMFGSVSCVSVPISPGYKCFTHKLMKSGSMATVKYKIAA